MARFKKNDIIQYDTAYGIIRDMDDHWYYVSWIGAGDGMLNIARHDLLSQMQKVSEYHPDTCDDILLYGKMKV